MAHVSTDIESRPLLGSDLRDGAPHPFHSKRYLQAFTRANLREEAKHTRHNLQRALTSKEGHYAVLALVTLDVTSIFADFVITIVRCETDNREQRQKYDGALQVLGDVGLVFSCLFMLELLASMWAFGSAYWRSKFHLFDAIVILVAFVVDVVLKGVLEEVASLVVVLRLWRVFKIIEELSAGAQEELEGMEERLGRLEKENEDLKRKTAP